MNGVDVLSGVLKWAHFHERRRSKAAGNKKDKIVEFIQTSNFSSQNANNVHQVDAFQQQIFNNSEKRKAHEHT